MMVDWLLKGVFSIVDHNSWTRNPVLNQPVEGQGLEHRSTDVRSSGLVPPNMCMAMESWLVVGLLCSDVIVQHQYLTCTQQNVQNFQRYLLKTAEQNTTALWPQQPWVGAKEKDAKVEMEKATEIAHDMPRHVMTPIVLDVWTSFQIRFKDFVRELPFSVCGAYVWRLNRVSPSITTLEMEQPFRKAASRGLKWGPQLIQKL